MFNIGGGELLVIFLVALVVLGPKRLPEVARQVGKWVGEFRKLSAGFQTEVRDAMKDPVSHAVKKVEALEPAPVDADTNDSDGTNDDSLPAAAPAQAEIVTLESVQVDEKPTPESTKIPPIAPMSGSDALKNAPKPDEGSPDGAAESRDIENAAAESTSSPEEPASVEFDLEDDAEPVDPPMFGDR